MNDIWGVDADPTAQGRIRGAKPVAVLDIGSNSVRLVVYERNSRALTLLYNEKASCALGRGIATTGRLADSNVRQALTAIRRFALVARLMRVGERHILATSAVREASNRDEFVSAVESIMEAPVRVLSGTEEAHFAALGAVSGMPGFAGVVGDLGGGSLELSVIADHADSLGETHELGVIRLQDDSGNSPSKAGTLAKHRLKNSPVLAAEHDGVFCAIGGTWRSLAKVHQIQRGYPLRMVQNYTAKASDMLKLCEEIIAAASVGKTYPGSDAVSSSRRDLVPYGAAVLAEILSAGDFKTVVFSALGVREGYLYGQLSPEEQAVHPLMQGAEEVSLLRSRSPAHAHDLIAFTEDFFDVVGLSETEDERRLREVACLLSDIGWRGHPDYRGEQSVDLVAYGSLTGVDHPGRIFLAEVLAVRYMGLKHKSLPPEFKDLIGNDLSARARLIGALFRVAYPMSAAMPGVLQRTRFAMNKHELELILPSEFEFLGNEHLQGRLDNLVSAASLKSGRIVVQ